MEILIDHLSRTEGFTDQTIYLFSITSGIDLNPPPLFQSLVLSYPQTSPSFPPPSLVLFLSRTLYSIPSFLPLFFCYSLPFIPSPPSFLCSFPIPYPSFHPLPPSFVLFLFLTLHSIPSLLPLFFSYSLPFILHPLPPSFVLFLSLTLHSIPSPPPSKSLVLPFSLPSNPLLPLFLS